MHKPEELSARNPFKTFQRIKRDVLILSCLKSISNNGGTFATPIAEQVIGNG